MKLTFLAAPQPLTKTYTRQKNGVIEKTPYPLTATFTSMTEDIKDLTAMHKAIVTHAKQGHCMLKGLINRPLNSESRAGSTSTTDSTEWLCLDIDGLPNEVDVEMPNLKTGGSETVRGQVDIDTVMDLLGLKDVSYIMQWSASHQVQDSSLRAHVFVMLEKPQAAPLLKQWLIAKNHDVELLAGSLSLTSTGMALRWPLDITTCQNDKLIYITSPLFRGMDDPIPPKDRIKLVKRKKAKAQLDLTKISTIRNQEQTQERIDALREIDGLPKRKFRFKALSNGVEVLEKPDNVILTDIKQERGFVYFNVNGGDSWAYYHPEDNPDYIYNFKGEPTYLTKELMPEYWAELTAKGFKETYEGLTYLAFCDKKTAAYWAGTYDAETDTLDLDVKRNETQVRHFAKQFGLPLGDYIPEMELTFDPHDAVRVDLANRIINTFQLSPYMRAEAKVVTKVPKTILKVMHNALGSDADITERFVNWLAYIVQQRSCTRTAWVLHGTTGTGKGVLVSRILRPLFGENQTTARRLEEFNEPYNGYIRNNFLVFVDEVETKSLNNEKGGMAKLKNFITEPKVTLRMMYQNGIEVPNYTNWIFSSNQPDPITLEKNDRRFNIAKYQPNKLITSEAELALIQDELQAFHDYLLHYDVRTEDVHTPMDTADRATLISISESALDSAISALLEGDFGFFVNQLPNSEAYKTNARDMNRVSDYRAALQTWAQRAKQEGLANVGVLRDELRTVFDYVVGSMPESPYKFTSLLKHHRLHIKQVSVGGLRHQGVRVSWSPKDFDDCVARLNPEAGKVAVKKVASLKRVK